MNDQVGVKDFTRNVDNSCRLDLRRPAPENNGSESDCCPFPKKVKRQIRRPKRRQKKKKRNSADFSSTSPIVSPVTNVCSPPISPDVSTDISVSPNELIRSPASPSNFHVVRAVVSACKPFAPFNTNQFLMEEHEPSLRLEEEETPWMESCRREFLGSYMDATVNRLRLDNLSKSQLVDKYMVLEKEFAGLKNRLRTLRDVEKDMIVCENGGELQLTAQASDKISVFRQEINSLQVENSNIRSGAQNVSSSSSSDDESSSSDSDSDSSDDDDNDIREQNIIGNESSNNIIEAEGESNEFATVSPAIDINEINSFIESSNKLTEGGGYDCSFSSVSFVEEQCNKEVHSCEDDVISHKASKHTVNNLITHDDKSCGLANNMEENMAENHAVCPKEESADKIATSRQEFDGQESNGASEELPLENQSPVCVDSKEETEISEFSKASSISGETCATRCEEESV